MPVIQSEAIFKGLLISIHRKSRRPCISEEAARKIKTIPYK